MDNASIRRAQGKMIKRSGGTYDGFTYYAKNQIFG
jgi:hypothetical protein